MASSPKAVTLPPGLLERLRSTLAAVRAGRFAPGEPGAGEATGDWPPPEELRAPPPDAPRAVIFVTVFGLSTAALEEVLEVVAREGKDTAVSPVFLTDSLDFKPFRKRRLRFEYLPDGGRRQRFAPDLDWPTYERRRYRLLAEKWRPQSVISFGTPPPADCAAAIRLLSAGA
ncbi:MAG: hypothetical protein K0S35_3415 [Geminicoccaceae bacterium]|nr:hypothetical protein [Geminicoccaceae bacterium]